VGPMQHPYRYSGGLKLSLLTWIRRAVIFPSASTWAATNTYSPGFKNEGSAGIVVPMGVPTGTRIFWVLPVYSSVSSCPLAVWTTAITLALVIIVSGCSPREYGLRGQCVESCVPRWRQGRHPHASSS